MRLDTLRPRLGKTFLDRLTGETVLTVGSTSYSRDRLVRDLKVGNFAAARRLGKVLDELEIANPADLARLAPEDLARVRGVGETTIYVLLCLQDSLKQPPLQWDTTWRTYASHARETKKNAKNPKSARQRRIRRVAEKARASVLSTPEEARP